MILFLITFEPSNCDNSLEKWIFIFLCLKRKFMQNNYTSTNYYYYEMATKYKNDVDLDIPFLA